MQDWKEMQVDTAVLFLYHLQAFYWNGWQCGFSGNAYAVAYVLPEKPQCRTDRPAS